jgi:hypothetical protein
VCLQWALHQKKVKKKYKYTNEGNKKKYSDGCKGSLGYYEKLSFIVSRTFLILTFLFRLINCIKFSVNLSSISIYTTRQRRKRLAAAKATTTTN